MSENSLSNSEVRRLADIILVLQRCFMLRISEDLSTGQISFPQFFLLGHLAEEEALSMSDIAGRMRHTTAAATGLVDRLESLGYASRAQSPEDRRKVLVHITPAGRALYNQVRDGIVKNLSGMMKHLLPAERRMWLQIYEKIISLCQTA